MLRPPAARACGIASTVRLSAIGVPKGTCRFVPDRNTWRTGPVLIFSSPVNFSTLRFPNRTPISIERKVMIKEPTKTPKSGMVSMKCVAFISSPQVGSHRSAQNGRNTDNIYAAKPAHLSLVVMASIISSAIRTSVAPSISRMPVGLVTLSSVMKSPMTSIPVNSSPLSRSTGPICSQIHRSRSVRGRTSALGTGGQIAAVVV